MIHDPHTSFVHLLLRAVVLAVVAGACAVLGQRKAELELVKIQVELQPRDGRRPRR
jgi:hypothetical protein